MTPTNRAFGFSENQNPHRPSCPFLSQFIVALELAKMKANERVPRQHEL